MSTVWYQLAYSTLFYNYLASSMMTQPVLKVLYKVNIITIFMILFHLKIYEEL